MALNFKTGDFKAAIQKSIAEAAARSERIRAYYLENHVPAQQIGERTGLVHAASILAWAKIAELVDVPFISAVVFAEIPLEEIMQLADGKPVTHPEFLRAEKWANAGGFWRSELCASGDVKYAMGEGHDLPAIVPIDMDMRLMEMHYGMTTFRVIARPRLTPIRVNGYPIEFRVFHGGQAQDGAASFYYPQAGHFEVTKQMEDAMTQSVEWAAKMHEARTKLGLTPWLPEYSEPHEGIGSTIDFMLTEEVGLVMVDAGPGFGYSAHPCCFIDEPVEGRRWHLADGVELR